MEPGEIFTYIKKTYYDVDKFERRTSTALAFVGEWSHLNNMIYIFKSQLQGLTSLYFTTKQIPLGVYDKIAVLCEWINKNQLRVKG